MACGCNKGVGTTGTSNTLGYYVILPGGAILPPGVDPDAPEDGLPPFQFYNEAYKEVIAAGGGTIKRLPRTPH